MISQRDPSCVPRRGSSDSGAIMIVPHQLLSVKFVIQNFWAGNCIQHDISQDVRDLVA